MDKSQIEKIYIFQKDNNPEEIYIFPKEGNPVKEKYNPDVHDKLTFDFLKDKGINISRPEDLEKSVGLFESYPIESDKHQEIEDAYTSMMLSDIEKDGMSSKAKVAALAGAAATLTGVGVGIASFVKHEDQKIVNTGTSVELTQVEELLEKLPIDNERRIFFETVNEVLGSLNTLSLDEEVFALKEDNDAKLQFMPDEVISAMIVLNNYSKDELKEIFGDKELDSSKILSDYEQFASKMALFAMNGKAASTVSNLIRDEENRNWFESLENKLVKFNKNQTNENADKLIRTFAYFYQHGINGTDNLENDEASLNGVKNLALNMMRGYFDANAEEEYQKYRVVSSNPSKFDNKYITNKLSQVQKGETLKFYIDQAEKGVCTISAIEKHIEETVDSLQQAQEEINDAKLSFVSALVSTDHSKLADSVLTNGINEETIEAINSDKDTSKIYQVYDEELLSVDQTLPSFNEIKEAIDKAYGPFVEVKDDVLYNNRIRGVEKINEISNSNGISKETWNSMSKEEQKEYAKKEGKVVGKTTKTEKQEVSYEDLSDKEKAEVNKQKEEIADKEVKIGDKTYEGDVTAAAKSAYTDASRFANQSGAYYYKDVYNNINPNYPTKVPHDGSLANIAQVAYAFDGKTITTSDSQIRSRLDSDMAKYEYTQEEKDAYKSAWLTTVGEILSTSISQGKVLRNQAEEEYKKALGQASKYNKENKPAKGEATTQPEATEKVEKPTKEQDKKPTKEQTTTEEVPVVEEEPNEDKIDPNLNPSIADSDEGFEDFYAPEGEEDFYRSNYEKYYTYFGDVSDEILENAPIEEPVLVKRK